MVVLLAPPSLSHACSALSVSWLGNPDAAPSSRMASIFGLASTWRKEGATPAVAALTDRSP